MTHQPDFHETLHVIQGEFRVSDSPRVVMTTLLGSCIATCLYDPVARVGGLNHFLLPGDTRNQGVETRYGINAMELLINALLKRGAQVSRLEAKVFGGATTLNSRMKIGEENAEFAFWFLRNEGIACKAQSVGGGRARRIRFWPCTGQAKQIFLGDGLDEAIVQRPLRPPPMPPKSGEIDLF